MNPAPQSIKELNFHSQICQTYYRQSIQKNSTAPSFDDVVNFAAEVCGSTSSAVFSKSRREQEIMARMLIWTYQESNLKYSLTLMGFMLGDRNHATVLSSRRRYSNLIDVDKRLQNCQEKFIQTINKRFPGHAVIMKKRE